MIHGLGSTLRSWDTIAPALSEVRELVLIDMPAHGGTPPLKGPPTVAAYADAIAAFIAEQKLDGVDVVGSSVGARFALELARRGVTGHCVALDPGGFWRGWETGFFRLTLLASIRLVRALQPVMPALSRNAVTRSLLMAQFSAKPWALPPDLVLAELRSFAATPVFDAMVNQLADGPLQAGTTTPPGRVTIGRGRNDRLLLPRQAERALAAFPTARLHWFYNCGHFPQFDRPQETVRVILDTVC